MPLYDPPRATIEKVIHGLSSALGMAAFAATLATLMIVFPVAGGWLGAGYMAGAAAGAAGIVKAAAIGMGVIGGALAGFVPLVVTNMAGGRKDPSYGALELMTVPSMVVDNAARLALSPLKLFDVEAAFNRAGRKEAPEKKEAVAPEQRGPHLKR